MSSPFRAAQSWNAISDLPTPVGPARTTTLTKGVPHPLLILLLEDEDGGEDNEEEGRGDGDGAAAAAATTAAAAGEEETKLPKLLV
jgi:hypothetical protein